MLEKLKVSAASFTRPADTTAYASGDLVANSTTAASVVPLTFYIPRFVPGRCAIRRFHLRKSGTGVSNAAFRLHLFTAIPTFATNGDNDPISGNTSGIADRIGALDLTSMFALADGAVGDGVPLVGPELIAQFELSGADSTGQARVALYGVLEARGAYTPASGEVFNADLYLLPTESR